MYFSVKKKRKKEKVSFMVSLPHHFNPVMGHEILHFPSLFQSIFTLLCCALPVSHWHTNTRLKRMWSSCKKTRVEWPFFMLIPTERARIYARTEGRGFVQIDQRDICKHTNPFLLFCLCAPHHHHHPGLPLLPLLSVNRSLSLLWRDTPTGSSFQFYDVKKEKLIV